YHFMFGLRGGSPVTATPSTLDGCSPPPAASFFSSSCMIKLNSGPRVSALVLSEIAVQECDAPLDHVIDDEKIHAENEYCDHHNRGGGAHFLPRWRGDLAHFGAHVVVKRLDSLRPGLEPVSKILTGTCDRARHLLRLQSHTALALSVVLPKVWQGRRDSNPQVRFWRPAV